MEWSKDSIVSRRFSKKVMGISEFEVRDFLHVLAEEARHLKQLNLNQKKKLAEQAGQIQDYKDREHILRQSIASAQEVADNIRRDAENHAQAIVGRANDKSEALVQEARHSLQTVYSDIADLKRLYLQFKTSLRASLQAQMELLDQGPLFSAPLPSGDSSDGSDSGAMPPQEGRQPDQGFGPQSKGQKGFAGRGFAAMGKDFAADPPLDALLESHMGEPSGAEEGPLESGRAAPLEKEGAARSGFAPSAPAPSVPAWGPAASGSGGESAPSSQNQASSAQNPIQNPAQQQRHSGYSSGRQGEPPAESGIESPRGNDTGGGQSLAGQNNPYKGAESRSGFAAGDPPRSAAGGEAPSFPKERDSEMRSLKASLRSLNKSFF